MNSFIMLGARFAELQAWLYETYPDVEVRERYAGPRHLRVTFTATPASNVSSLDAAFDAKLRFS